VLHSISREAVLRTAAPFELPGWYFGTTRPIVRLVVDLIIRVVLYYLFVAMYVYGRTLPTVLQYCTYYKDKKDTKGKRGQPL